MFNSRALRLVTPVLWAGVSLVQVVRLGGGYLTCTPNLLLQAGGPEAWAIRQAFSRRRPA